MIHEDWGRRLMVRGRGRNNKVKESSSLLEYLLWKAYAVSLFFSNLLGKEVVVYL